MPTTLAPLDLGIIVCTDNAPSVGYTDNICDTIMLMVIALLVVLGLCFGSFVNALVWRVHEQEAESHKKRPDKKYLRRLSMRKGRSMCSECHHELAAKDLIPLVSWLTLRGKCRYCHKLIADSPLVEVLLPVLFVASYVWWPADLTGVQLWLFGLWLVLLVGLVALLVYDMKWLLLPNRMLYPLFVVAGVAAVLKIIAADQPFEAVLSLIAGVAIGGGIFYLLFQVSNGKWIGGGDVRLGWLLGLVAATPGRSLLFIFLAAFTGSLVSVPLMARGSLKRTSVVPFGPFLIIGAIIVQLFGSDILGWYQRMFVP